MAAVGSKTLRACEVPSLVPEMSSIGSCFKNNYNINSDNQELVLIWALKLLNFKRYYSIESFLVMPELINYRRS